MQLIVAVDQNWGIGFRGKLLFSIPEDMRRFRRITTGKTIVMGHGTLRSLPGGKPLCNRRNIVLSNDPALTIENAVVCHSIDELLRGIAEYRDGDVIAIGGQAVYQQVLDYCSMAYVTKIHREIEHADRFFPDLDRMGHWKIVEASDCKTYLDLTYSFHVYQNMAAKKNPYCIVG